MTASELRIGNWVEIKDQVVRTYAQIEGLGNLQHVAGQLWSIEELEPIPLTEEWFERFGFKFEQMKLYTVDNCFVKEKFCVLCYGELKNYDLRLTFDSDQTIRVKLDYVHQLQNLYFALTGEELELKP